MLNSLRSSLLREVSAPLGRDILLLTAFAILIAVARWHTYAEPMDRDLGDYATVAHEMHHGRHLYTDLPDQKPPAIHLTYYLAEAIAGYHRSEIYGMAVFAAVLTLAAVYLAIAPLAGRRGALWAAAIWTVISGDLHLEANQPNAEVFMNAFLVLGIAILARSYRKPGNDWLPCVAAGLCFAWATLYKHVLVVTPALIGLACFIAPPPGKSRWRAFKEMAVMGAVIAGAWVLVFLYFAWSGQLAAFIQWVITYNWGYAGNLDSNLLGSLGWIFPDFMKTEYPLIALALAGMVLQAFQREHRFVVLLLAAMAVGTQIAVALPGKYFPHYYQLWFPWLILGAGTGIAAVERAFSVRTGTYVGVLVLGLVAAEELPNYCLPAEQWSDMKYGSIFIDSNAVARRANEILKPQETLFQLGDETEFYPVTGRRCLSSITAVAGLCEGKFMDSLRVRLIAELKQAPPDLIIMAEDAEWEFSSDRPFMGFFKEHYTPVLTGQTAPYSFLARKGSDLGPGSSHPID